MSILLKNIKAVTLDPPRIEACDVRIDDGVIIERALKLKPRRDDEVVDLDRCIVMPGFVCSHTHLYSALSRGMPALKSSPKNFLEILKNMWWKLDRALDEEAIYYSALVGTVEAAKLGTTTLIDHHASPNFIRGSLDLVKHGMCQVGLRGILCYETTDRGGRKRRNLGLEENERFVTENISNAHFRGTIGGHASFTLSDDSLSRLGELATMYDCGVHVHVAEDCADVEDSEKRFGRDIIGRFAKAGILRKKSIFAHGVHLSQKQLARIENAGAWMIHNPRSNMNNAVGYAPLGWFGSRTALGTDGFAADMFEEAKLGFFRNAESGSRVAFPRFPAILNNGQKIVSEFFGRPFGTFAKGTSADLAVLEYASPTPLTSKNITAHFLFGMNSAMVRHVMVGGRWVVWDRQVIGIDEDVLMQKAAKVAKKLWSRMHGR